MSLVLANGRAPHPTLKVIKNIKKNFISDFDVRKKFLYLLSLKVFGVDGGIDNAQICINPKKDTIEFRRKLKDR